MLPMKAVSLQVYPGAALVLGTSGKALTYTVPAYADAAGEQPCTPQVSGLSGPDHCRPIDGKTHSLTYAPDNTYLAFVFDHECTGGGGDDGKGGDGKDGDGKDGDGSDLGSGGDEGKGGDGKDGDGTDPDPKPDPGESSTTSSTSSTSTTSTTALVLPGSSPSATTTTTPATETPPLEVPAG